MITKIDKFELLLNDKKDAGKHYLYSQIIKNERTKRRLTLQEMAKGICSVSYLCKFERNSIIADETYIKAIFERIHLDYEKVGLNIIEDGVKNIIKAYLYNNYQEINNIYNLVDDSLFNAQNYLIKGFYYIINENYLEFKNIISTIDNIKETLLKEDIGVFMFLVIEYYVKTHQYNEAHKYLKYIDNMEFENSNLNWLIYEQQFLVGFNMKKYPTIYKYYFKLLGNYNIGYPSKRQLLIRLLMLYLETDEYFPSVYNEIKNINLAPSDDEYYYYTCYLKYAIMIKGGMWVEVFDKIIENNFTHDVRFIALLLHTADLINDNSYIKKALHYIKDFNFEENDTIHQKFIRFLLIKFGSEKKYTLIEYLKYNIIPYNNTYIHFIYNEVYERYYVEYLCKTSKYKEAVSFYKK